MPEREAAPDLLLGYLHPASKPEATTVEKLVLKSGELFAVTDLNGDIAPAGARDQGFFYRDTRFLSFLKLSVAGGPPVVLSSQTSPDYVTQVDMTVTSRSFGGVFSGDPVNFLHLRREQLIEGCLIDRYVLTNYLTRPLDYWMALEFAADFADVFEVRGAFRPRRGIYEEPHVEPDRVVWRYRGLDGRRYETELLFEAPPFRLEGRGARFDLHLGSNESTTIELRVNPLIRKVRELPAPRLPFGERRAAVRELDRAFHATCTHIESCDPFFDQALHQAIGDLHALGLPDGERRLLSAGIPWYAAPFGRDSLITAYQALPFAPGLARDSLAFLAAHQGRKVDETTEEEPGRILHELRVGEMAEAREIPHVPYYGSVDATPLFVILLHEYLLWTDDKETVRALLPAAEAAIDWMRRWADRDADGFLEYQRHGERGLYNQGWKDSADGVCFPDGTRCEAPIALVEVQGYAVDAYRRMAMLYRLLGIRGKARPLLEHANALAHQLDEAFWLPETEFYGLALDREKRLAPTLTSNAGHLLWSKAVPGARAQAVARRLLGPSFHSGWGLRTLAEGQGAYNPLSYHNGTIWPHDNSLVAMGLSSYGLPHGALEVFEALYGAAQYFRLRRLPELFCGLPRKAGEFPVQYPVACSPQAWASGALLLLLRAALGLHPDATHRKVTIKNPHLPMGMRELTLRNLRIGETRLDLRFTREGEGCFAAVPSVEGAPLEVRIALGRHG